MRTLRISALFILGLTHMQVRRFAAIDIGSNSVRLLIEQVIETPSEIMFKKNSLIRVPVRLGADTFNGEKILHGTIEKLVDAMTAFRCIMNINEVVHFKACATSALREAENHLEVVETVRRRSGIHIDVISGALEANAINTSQSAYALKLGKDCLFIDVGGGSTEAVVFADGEARELNSFPIGTVRLLNDKVKKEQWREMKEWLRDKTKAYKKLTMVGSGGNINRLFKLSQLQQDSALPFSTLQNLVDKLAACTVDERIERFDLNSDRADVIVFAGEIFTTIMKWFDIEKIYVPKIGLSDGLVKQAFYEYKESLIKQSGVATL